MVTMMFARALNADHTGEAVGGRPPGPVRQHVLVDAGAPRGVVGVRSELRLAIRDRERRARAAGNVPMVGGASDQLLDLERSQVPVVVADLRCCLVPDLGGRRLGDRGGNHREDRGDGKRGHGVAAHGCDMCHTSITLAVTRSWLLRLLRPDGYGLRRSRSTRGRSWVPASPPVVGGLCVTYRPHPSGRPSSPCAQASANRPWEGGGALACRGRNGRPSVADRPTLDNNFRN